MPLVLRREVPRLDAAGDLGVDVAPFEEVVDLLVGESELILIGTPRLTVEQVGDVGTEVLDDDLGLLRER